MNRRRLYRSERDRVIAGVAGGVADYFDVDPTLVRVIWVVLCFVPPLPGIWLYIVMAIVVPPEPGEWRSEGPWAPGGTPVGYPASYTPPPDTATPDAAGDASVPPSDTTQTWTPDGSGSPAPNSASQPGWTAPGAPDWRAARRQERWDRRQDRWQRRQERWQGRHDRWEARSGSGGLLFGLLLILVGGVLLWHQVDPRLNFDLAWPAIIVLFGVVLIAFSVFPGRPREK